MATEGVTLSKYNEGEGVTEEMLKPETRPEIF